MKILVVAYDVSLYCSGGSVNKKLAEGLASSDHTVSILSSRVNSEQSFHARYVLAPQYEIPSKFAKLVIIVFGRDIRFLCWMISAYSKYFKAIKKFNPDIVYALGSSGKGCVLSLSHAMAKKLKKPLAIHLVDPIPPPKHYENNALLRRRMPSTIEAAMKYSSLLSINNSDMLAYQQKCTNCDISSKAIVLPDPIESLKTIITEPPSASKLVLTYLGTLTEARNPSALLSGFAQYCEVDPNSELRILGHNEISLMDYPISEEVVDKIIFHEWISDVETACRESSILIDVDADAEDDIFTSHKIKEYLTIDRVILLITRKNSPSSRLFRNMNRSIVICDHSPESIKDAIHKASSITYDPSIFRERERVLKYLHIDAVMNRLLAKFEEIVVC